MKAGERRERTLAHARLDILEAATRAFARTGLHSTTMQDIAREAGYTAASLYTYFKSKREIVDAMSNYLTDEYIQVFEQPLPGGLNFRQRFELMLQRQLELADKRRTTFMAFVGEEASEGLCEPDGHRASFHTNFERRIDSLAEWLRRNAEKHDLSDNEPQIIARLFFGMAFGLLHKWRGNVEPATLVGYAPILSEFFFHGASSKSKPGARKR